MQVYYYNTRRIHTALKTSPAAYAASLMKPRCPAPITLDSIVYNSSNTNSK